MDEHRGDAVARSTFQEDRGPMTINRALNHRILGAAAFSGALLLAACGEQASGSNDISDAATAVVPAAADETAPATTPISSGDGAAADGSTTTTQVLDDTTSSTQAETVASVPDGANVFVLTGQDPVPARLGPGPDAEIASEFIPGLDGLVSTAGRFEADGQVWVNMAARDEVPELWFPADRLAAVGELIESTEPSIHTIIGDELVDAARWPDGEGTGTFAPGDEVPVTGYRALLDGREWIEIDGGEERGRTWIPADRSEMTEGLVSRSCYGDDSDNLLVLDFATGGTFTGVLTYLDSVEQVAGRLDVGAGAQWVVNVSPIGSAEDIGEPTVTTETWRAFPSGLDIADRAFLAAVDCDAAVADGLIAIAGGTYPAVPE